MSNIITHHYLIHCAGVAFALAVAFVISVPKPETAAADVTADTAKTAVSSAIDAGAKATGSTAACLQTWPYYERSCLRDSRRGDGYPHAVRVIAVNGQPGRRAPHQ